MPSLHAMSFGKVRRLLEALDEAGLSETQVEQLLRLDDPEHLEHRRRSTSSLMRWWVEDLKRKLDLDRFTQLIVDYPLSVEEMLVAGDYGVTRGISSASYPHKDFTGSECVLVLLHAIERPMHSLRIIAELEIQGLRPATMAELLTYGSKHPDEQTRHWIVALGQTATLERGSATRRHRQTAQPVRPPQEVGILGSNEGGRFARSYPWFDTTWETSYRFLAVRK